VDELDAMLDTGILDTIRQIIDEHGQTKLFTGFGLVLVELDLHRVLRPGVAARSQKIDFVHVGDEPRPCPMNAFEAFRGQSVAAKPVQAVGGIHLVPERDNPEFFVTIIRRHVIV